jgi:predicted nucleotide-binding protein
MLELFFRNRADSWVEKVVSFLDEIFGRTTAEDFINAGSDMQYYIDAVNQKKLHLLGFYERYQAQRNKGGDTVEVYQTYVSDNTEHDRKVEEPSKMDASVFIVHGHENETKETVARYVEKLGFRAIVLHEQPNKGKTIIEKFESFADRVDFTIILLTPDDIGASISKKNEPKYRARQNVIFEFGFFTAKVGRSKVCALVKGNIEIPSDYSGVIYIPIDESGAWKMALVKEMKNAGLVIDPDKLLG